MKLLVCTLYVALMVVVWELASSSSHRVEPTTTIIVPLTNSSVRDDRFVAFRYDVPVPDALDEPDNTGDTAHDGGDGHRHQFLERTAALATELHCFGWIQRLPQVGLSRLASKIPTLKVPVFAAHLKSMVRLDTVPALFYYYPHGKIRFHFPRFRVLSGPAYQAGSMRFVEGPHRPKKNTIYGEYVLTTFCESDERITRREDIFSALYMALMLWRQQCRCGDVYLTFKLITELP